jgi:hypothetical protein
MRLTPKSIFVSIVTLGFPFAVAVGWTVGAPTPAPPSMSEPAGAGGLGSAPTAATATVEESIVEWRPRAPKRVAREESVPSAHPRVTTPSATPSATVLPVPTSAQVTSPPPSSSAPAPSADPERGLDPAQLVGRP